MERKDGGPAYPVPHSIDGNWQREPRAEFSGMSLRDYFAGQALAAIIVAFGHTTISSDVESAYEYADAMLAQRDR